VGLGHVAGLWNKLEFIFELISMTESFRLSIIIIVTCHKHWMPENPKLVLCGRTVQHFIILEQLLLEVESTQVHNVDKASVILTMDI
jgi:hypothetical protein